MNPQGARGFRKLVGDLWWPNIIGAGKGSRTWMYFLCSEFWEVLLLFPWEENHFSSDRAYLHGVLLYLLSMVAYLQWANIWHHLHLCWRFVGSCARILLPHPVCLVGKACWVTACFAYSQGKWPKWGLVINVLCVLQEEKALRRKYI